MFTRFYVLSQALPLLCLSLLDRTPQLDQLLVCPVYLGTKQGNIVECAKCVCFVKKCPVTQLQSGLAESCRPNGASTLEGKAQQVGFSNGHLGFGWEERLQKHRTTARCQTTEAAASEGAFQRCLHEETPTQLQRTRGCDAH